MGWTTTLDASHKVKRGGSHAVGFARHLAREADTAAGFAFGHSNDGLDPARLALNRTMVNDGAGGYRAPAVTAGADGERRPPSAEALDYLDARLATVKRPLRKDAVILRPLVFKADPAWYDEVCPDWRTTGLNAAARQLHEEALRFVEERFGQDNVVMWADHLDEAGHPERQIAVTMVTDDGRLSQKDFYPGPAAMRKMHADLRTHLKQTCGYDAEMSVSPRSTEHLNSHDYARQADQVKAKTARVDKELEGVIERDKKSRVENRKVKAALDARAAQLDQAEARLDARAAKLDEGEKALAAAQQQLAGDRKLMEWLTAE
ncbi:plasmid recombination protein, partial [Rhodococcus pyridinivorans]|uniref:plasmid recombination protein n=1 Tax=Rhodococcus pyridinivorans TaxID=103816 RepID=UPI002658CB31